MYSKCNDINTVRVISITTFEFSFTIIIQHNAPLGYNGCAQLILDLGRIHLKSSFDSSRVLARINTRPLLFELV